MPVLSGLKDRYALAVVTNTGSEDFQTLHWDAAQLLELFDAMILREHYVRSKPEPDAYLAAMLALEVAAEEVMVVEDSPRGIAAARSAGARVVARRNPHFPDLDLSGAETVIASLEELPSLLEAF